MSGLKMDDVISANIFYCGVCGDKATKIERRIKDDGEIDTSYWCDECFISERNSSKLKAR